MRIGTVTNTAATQGSLKHNGDQSISVKGCVNYSVNADQLEGVNISPKVRSDMMMNPLEDDHIKAGDKCGSLKLVTSNTNCTPTTLSEVISVAAMPTTTTVTTTTTVAASVVQTSHSQQTIAAMMTTQATVTISDQHVGKDNKRKQPDEEGEKPENKKTIVDSMPGVDLLLKELIGIKTMISDVNTKVTTIDSKFENIQEENKEWKERMVNLESDMNEVKRSVEMAHNLIADETQNRKAEVKELRTELNQKASKAMHNLQLLKTQAGELKTIKESMKGLNSQLDIVDESQKKAEKPVHELKKLVNEALGATEFPVKNILVAQNVWCDEHENLDKVASTIIHKALSLPDIRIVRTL